MTGVVRFSPKTLPACLQNKSYARPPRDVTDMAIPATDAVFAPVPSPRPGGLAT